MDTREITIAIGAFGAIGALTDFGLSFTSLSPLVKGGIVGSILPALVTIFCTGYLIYKFCKKYPINKVDKIVLAGCGIITLASAAIGVGLAAGTTLSSAAIAPIALVLGVVAAAIIGKTAEKVNEYIISPIIEHFSSKEKEHEPV